MAELLIKAFTGGGEDPGDVVEVRPDGFFDIYLGRSGGKAREFDPSRFLILKLPGLPLSTTLHLMRELNDPLYYDPERPQATRLLKRRRWTISAYMDLLGPYHERANIHAIPEALVSQYRDQIADKGGT